MTTLSMPADRAMRGPEPQAPVLDIVLPVHNEQHVLTHAVRRLHRYLSEYFAYPFRITVADSASTDSTLAIAHSLAEELRDVRVVHLGQKGRGRALRAAWLDSDAAVLAYMDVDLSTDLAAFAPLVAPLMSGHSDLSIGSRIAVGSNVVRGPRREVISRCYNRLLHASLGARFTDAQCGFKAIRQDVAQALLPLVLDDEWFFDTELLTLAQRAALRIHEVPVDWYDDPDTRVEIVDTALDDLAGIRRMRRTLRQDPADLAQIRRRMGRGTASVDGPDGAIVHDTRRRAPLRHLARGVLPRT